MVVTGIDIVPDSAVNDAAPAIANVATLNATPVPVAEIASEKALSVVGSRLGRLIPAKLSGIKALLLTRLARSSMTVATQLALAVLISLAALVSLSIRTASPVVASRARHRFDLVSQLLYLIHELSLALLIAPLFALLRLAHTLAGLIELLAQFRESLGDPIFSAPGG